MTGSLMTRMLHNTQLCVKERVACGANDAAQAASLLLRMAKSERQRRNHYIPEWAEHRGVSQADITRGIEVDKSTVSRWFANGPISEAHADRLASFLGAGEAAALFNHPLNDWVAKFMQDRTDEERERMKQTLEAAFPRRVA